MPTRKALLIAAPGGISSTFLPGTRTDLDNVYNFLCSARGGAWKDDEITCFYDASPDEIDSALASMYADYTITYFSGHGYTNFIDQRKLLLTDGTDFKDIDLLNDSPKQLILVDACRNIMPAGIYGLEETGDVYYNFTGDSELVGTARKLYDQWIELCPAGKLIIHSASKDQSSYETSNGGYFTQALLGVGKRVKAENRFEFMSIFNAGNYTPKILRKLGLSQRPSVAYKEGNFHLPFALGVPKRRKGSNGGGWLLALGIAAGLIIAANSED